MNLNNLTLPTVEAVKEVVRYAMLLGAAAALTVVWNFACDYTGLGIKLPLTEAALTGGAAFRFLDKLLHELGKALSTRKAQSNLVGGLTRI